MFISDIIYNIDNFENLNYELTDIKTVFDKSTSELAGKTSTYYDIISHIFESFKSKVFEYINFSNEKIINLESWTDENIKNINFKDLNLATSIYKVDKNLDGLITYLPDSYEKIDNKFICKKVYSNPLRPGKYYLETITYEDNSKIKSFNIKYGQNMISDMKELFKNNNCYFVDGYYSLRGELVPSGIVEKNEYNSLKDMLSTIFTSNNNFLNIDSIGLENNAIYKMKNYCIGWKNIVQNDSGFYNSKVISEFNLTDDSNIKIVLEKKKIENNENFFNGNFILDPTVLSQKEKSVFTRLLNYKKFPTNNIMDNYYQNLALSFGLSKSSNSKFNVSDNVFIKKEYDPSEKYLTIEEIRPDIIRMFDEYLRGNLLGEELLNFYNINKDSYFNKLDLSLNESLENITDSENVTEKFLVSHNTVSDDLSEMLQTLLFTDNEHEWKIIK